MSVSLKGKDWRRWLSDLMILAGVSLLLCVSLLWIKTALAAQELDHKSYLVSTVGLDLPLPTLTATSTPLPTPTQTPFPTVIPTASPTPIPPTETPSPTPVPSAGPVIRLVIPRIKVDRAVVPVGLHRVAGGAVQWDTDALFANRNRLDLVGQLANSANPGEGGNIILVGHNYNNGWYALNGVFVNLDKLHPGDKIIVHSGNGGTFQYNVELVKKVPWRQKNVNELEKHQKFLWPKENEQLTLVTCGGANVWTWSARIYVVAKPVEQNNP